MPYLLSEVCRRPRPASVWHTGVTTCEVQHVSVSSSCYWLSRIPSSDWAAREARLRIHSRTHAHKSRSRFLTLDHTGAPIETCHNELFGAKWALLFKIKEEENETSISASLGLSSFSFFSAIFSGQNNPLMLSSVLDQTILAQCLHGSRCVKLYVCKIRHGLTSSLLQPPVCARPSGRRACLSRRCALQSHSAVTTFPACTQEHVVLNVIQTSTEGKEWKRGRRRKRRRERVNGGMKGGERACGEERLNPANIPLKCGKVAEWKRSGAKPTCPFSRYLCVCVTLRQTQQWACNTSRELEVALMQRNGLWVPFSAPTLYELYRIIWMLLL